MKKILPFFLFGSFFFLLFFVFSFLVHKDVFTQVDFDATVRMQDNIPRRFDTFFSWFSVIGNFETYLIVLGVLIVFVRKIIFGFMALSMFALFHIIEIIGKTSIHHPPPPEFLLRTQRLIEFPQFHVRSDFSYPSGHSGRTIFLSILIALLIIRSKKIPGWVKCFSLAVLVGFDTVMLISRVYLGEHWLTDVIGGSLLGASLAIGVGMFLSLESRLKKSYTASK